MELPYGRVYNFSAGPGGLPLPVLEEIHADLFNWKGRGMSVMEMSHRSKDFEGILSRAEADLRKLAAIPDDYRILFLQGGASLQGSMVPINFLREGQRADYAVTGYWGQKAYEMARIEGDVNLVFSDKENGYRCAPENIEWNDDAAYAHYTSNETIGGVQFKSVPKTKAPLVCDMSSDILSAPTDWRPYSLVYAGAQKNMGPAGTTVVIVKDDFLATAKDGNGPMLDYREHAKNGSMYNTPPCWAIYVCGLVYRYLLENGGLEAVQVVNERKAKVVYDAIDRSGGFYRGHAKVENRSTMNVSFLLPDEELTNRFVAEADARGLNGLKGHRSIGGIRASIYNAFPEEGCHALAAFMDEFARKNG
jgi:phosphoserine aminotransferase